MTSFANSSQLFLVAAVLAQLWANIRYAPKPPFYWSHSAFNCSTAYSGCTDDAEATVDERDHLIDVAAFHRHLWERGHVLELLKPLRHAVFDVSARFFFRLCQVHHAD